MAQGEGYWYNPKTNIAIQVSRHEVDLKNPSTQKKLNLAPTAVDALNDLTPSPKNEDKIKMLGVRVGLVRVRDWQKFTSVQFYDSGNKAKDVLFSLAQLIDAHQNKDYSKLKGDTKKFTKLLGTSWQLKIDNLKTGDSDTVSPSSFLKKYAEPGYMEEKKEKKMKDKRPVRDIPMSEEGFKEIDKLLEEHDYFLEQEISILFEDEDFRKESKKYGILDEDITLSRVWKVANDGEHVFAMLSGFRNTKDPKVNKARNKVLERILRKKGYGFNKVNGYWAELNRDSVDISDIDNTKEDSFFVTVRIPEDEIDKGVKGSTVQKFISDMANLIGGKDSEDGTVPEMNEVLSGKTGFNQDMIAIKLDPRDPRVFLMNRDKEYFPIGEIEFFSDIRESIKKLPKDISDKLKSGAGGIAFSDLMKAKGGANVGGSFRAGNLKKGE